MTYEKNNTSTNENQRSFSAGTSANTKISRDNQSFDDSVRNRMKAAGESARAIDTNDTFRGQSGMDYTDLNAPHQNGSARNINPLNAHISNDSSHQQDLSIESVPSDPSDPTMPLPNYNQPESITSKDTSNVSIFDHYTHENQGKTVTSTLASEFQHAPVHPFTQPVSDSYTAGLSSETEQPRNCMASLNDSIDARFALSEKAAERSISSDKPSRTATSSSPDFSFLDGKTIQEKTVHSGVADITYTINRDATAIHTTGKGKHPLSAEISLNKEHKKGLFAAADAARDTSDSFDNEADASTLDNLAEHALRHSSEKSYRQIDDFRTIQRTARADRKAIKKAEDAESTAKKLSSDAERFRLDASELVLTAKQLENRAEYLTGSSKDKILEQAAAKREEAIKLAAKARKLDKKAEKQSIKAAKKWGSFAPASDRWVDENGRFTESNRFFTATDRFAMENEDTVITEVSARSKLSKEDLKEINDIAQANVRRRDKRSREITAVTIENSRTLTASELKEGIRAKERAAKDAKKKEVKKAASKTAFANALKGKRLLQNDAGNMSERSSDDLLANSNTGLIRFGKETVSDFVKDLAMKLGRKLVSIIGSLVSSLASALAAMVLPIASTFIIPLLAMLAVVIVVVAAIPAAFINEYGDSGDETPTISVDYDQWAYWGCDGYVRQQPFSQGEIDAIINNLWATYYRYNYDPNTGYGEWYEHMSYYQERVLRYALSKVGCNYDQANHFDTDVNVFDCSSLAYRSYANISQFSDGSAYGIDISNDGLYSAAEECRAGINRGQFVPIISPDSIYPGDLIFWGGSDNGRYNGIYHVAIYVGNGKIIEARNTNMGVVYGDIRNISSSCTFYVIRPYQEPLTWVYTDKSI